MQVITHEAVHPQKEMPTTAMAGTPNKVSSYSCNSTDNSLQARIPQQLRVGMHWLNWIDTNGRKSPVNAEGVLKGYNDQSTWVQLELALDRYGDNGRSLGLTLKEDGLLLEEGYLWCLDFDGWVSGSEFDDDALALVKDLGTLSEVSQSGTGLKLYMTSDRPPLEKFKIQFAPSKFAVVNPNVRKYQNREIEVFSKRSFLATTFDLVEAGGTELRHFTSKELEALFERLQHWAVSTGGAGCKEPKWRDSFKPQITCPSSKTRPKTEYKQLTFEQLELAIVHINADDEHVWSDVANILSRVYGEEGRDSWHLFSRQSAKYDFDQCEQRYDRALRELVNRPDGYGIKHLIELAKTHPDWSKVADRFQYWGEIPDMGGGLYIKDPIQLPINLGANDPISQINNDFAWDTHGLQIYSRKTGMYVRKDGFLTNYANKLIQVANKQISVGGEWLKSTQRLEVNGFVLSPKEGWITANGALNTWRGYSVESTKGDVTPFTDTLAHVIPNASDRAYILQWLAKAIQNPEMPFKVALAVHGAMQGVGKNTVFEAVGELLNPHHYAVIGNAELSSAFSDWMIDKVLVIGDEVSNGGNRSDADRMKRYITATENCINPKGLPPLRQPNLIKYILLSNRDDIVYLEGEDRRYFVAETGSERMPPVLVKRFYDWKKSGGLSHLLAYLLEVDTSGFDPTAPAPMTEAKANVIEAGKSGLDLWVEEEVSALIAKGQYLTSASNLNENYRRATGITSSPKAVCSSLKKAGCQKLKKQALLKSGRRRWVWSVVDHAAFANASESELGRVFESYPY